MLGAGGAGEAHETCAKCVQPLTTDTNRLLAWMTGGGDDGGGGRRSASNEWLAYNAFRTNALTICRFVQQQRRGERLQAAQLELTGALGHLSDDARRLLKQQVRVLCWDSRECACGDTVEGPRCHLHFQRAGTALPLTLSPSRVLVSVLFCTLLNRQGRGRPESVAMVPFPVRCGKAPLGFLSAHHPTARSSLGCRPDV